MIERSNKEAVVILPEDWAKIYPYIEDGTFDPARFPTSGGGVSTLFGVDTLGSVDVTDKGLYSRIYQVLLPHFQEYPTTT